MGEAVTDRTGADRALYVSAVIAVVLVNWFWLAFVVTRLWAMFVAPLGVFEIGIAHALGLQLLISLVKSSWRDAALDDPVKQDGLLMKSLTRSGGIGLSWALGSIIAGFM